jgi:hypothetical protein
VPIYERSTPRFDKMAEVETEQCTKEKKLMTENTVIGLSLGRTF